MLLSYNIQFILRKKAGAARQIKLPHNLRRFGAEVERNYVLIVRSRLLFALNCVRRVEDGALKLKDTLVLHQALNVQHAADALEYLRDGTRHVLVQILLLAV